MEPNEFLEKLVDANYQGETAARLAIDHIFETRGTYAPNPRDLVRLMYDPVRAYFYAARASLQDK